MFEIYQLEQLLAFAECGTLSGAAERLHLSQPALSRSMQRLEAELQVPLFDRQKNKIEFNENGRMAAEYARQVMEKCQDMISRVQAFDRSQRTILLGSCAPAPLWRSRRFCPTSIRTGRSPRRCGKTMCSSRACGMTSTS